MLTVDDRLIRRNPSPFVGRQSSRTTCTQPVQVRKQTQERDNNKSINSPDSTSTINRLRRAPVDLLLAWNKKNKTGESFLQKTLKQGAYIHTNIPQQKHLRMIQQHHLQ